MNSKIGLRKFLIIDHRETDGKYDSSVIGKEDGVRRSNIHLIEISKRENGGEKNT